MVSVIGYLNEGKVWSSIKSSFANLFGGPTKVKKSELTSNDKINNAEATYRRLTPKPLASSRNKLGYKPKKTTV